MNGESHTRNWIKPAVGVCVLAIAGIGLAVGYQITIHDGIRKFNNAVLVKDCPQIEQSARVLTGIFQYGVDDTQSTIVADVLGQCKLLAEARLSLQSDEYLAAQTQYWGFATQYPSSPFVPTVSREGQDSILLDAEAKHASGSYEEALIIFGDFITKYPQYPFRRRAKDGYTSTLQDWINHLRTLQQYPQALSNCEKYAIESIPATVSWCSDQKPLILFDWGASLYEAGDTEGAAPLFFNALALIDSSSPVYSEMLEKYPDVMIAWAIDLRSAGKYLKALDVLSALKGVHTEKEILARIEAEYSTTLDALAEDSGEDGKAVMEEAITALCSPGDKPVSLAIGRIPNAPRRGNYCKTQSNLSTYFPASRLATKPSEFYYYVIFSNSSEVIARCAYMGGHTLLRQRNKMIVYVKQVSSRKELYRNTFYGPPPESCPYSYKFGLYEKEKSIYGGPPPSTPIYNWLETVLK